MDIELRYIQENNEQREWYANFYKMAKDANDLSQEIEQKKAEGAKSLGALSLEFSRIQKAINSGQF